MLSSIFSVSIHPIKTMCVYKEMPQQILDIVLYLGLDVKQGILKGNLFRCVISKEKMCRKVPSHTWEFFYDFHIDIGKNNQCTWIALDCEVEDTTRIEMGRVGV